MPATQQAIENKALGIYLPQLERLDAVLDGYIRDDLRQFMIVRAHRYGVPIYEYCGGTSTNPDGVRQDGISCVFSITKPTVSTLIMKLQEDGLLDISEPVAAHLDYFRGKENILIWHLMTHSGGIVDEDYYNFQNEYAKTEFGLTVPGHESSGEEWAAFSLAMNQQLGLAADADYELRNQALFALFTPTKSPGELMSYSNVSYRFLGKLIAAVSGTSIDEYSRRVLFEPLGMNDTHFILPKEKWDRVTGRGERCSEYGYVNSPNCYENDRGSGGLKSTVIDLCRFGDMLLGNGTLDGVRVLSPASVREMSQNHNRKLSEKQVWDSWALGFNLRGGKKDDAGVLRSDQSLEHGGMCGCKFLADPVYGVSISMMTGEYNPPGKNVYYPVNNIIISALD